MSHAEQGVVANRIAGGRQYQIGAYRYLVWPYKGIDEIAPEELEQLVDDLVPLVPGCSEALLTFVADGLILGVALSQATRLPLIVCRDHHYNMPERVELIQKTAYFSRKLYFAKPSPGRAICIIDAIISTGGTVCAAGSALCGAGCRAAGVVAALEKVSYGGRERIVRELGIEPRVVYRLIEQEAAHLSVERV